MSGDGESRRQPTNPGLHGKWLMKPEFKHPGARAKTRQVLLGKPTLKTTNKTHFP